MRFKNCEKLFQVKHIVQLDVVQEDHLLGLFLAHIST